VKNRFNWIFELLRSTFNSAHSQYLRGAEPSTDRTVLFDSLSAAIGAAKERQNEFPGEPQYELFLNSYIGILEDFLAKAREREDLESLLQNTRERIVALEDDIRLHLK